MKLIRAEADKLEEILQGQGQLADQLYECACRMAVQSAYSESPVAALLKEKSEKTEDK